MPYYTYILKSIKNSRYYTGYTSNLKQRIKLHNYGKNLATKSDRPWKLFYAEEFSNEANAIKQEHQIKRWKSRKAIERLKFK